ncbi:MAG TPA: cytidylate kinase-like family protein [Candidatus Dorea intestinavium]|nr:cytidylate kinase-like family protein [Candidatus Dorea intestinavium]
MAFNTVFAIGREFGSGGHEVGEELAKRLNIPFYDKKLVTMAAEKLNISSITAATLDEKTLDYFLATYKEEDSKEDIDDSSLPLSEQLYLAQANIIRSLAAKGPCVIVGRCADYILRDNPKCVSVFIYGNDLEKIARISSKYQLTDKKAKEKIKMVDSERRYYYESRTGKEWASSNSHQMLFNSSLLPISQIVKVLEGFYEEKE